MICKDIQSYAEFPTHSSLLDELLCVLQVSGDVLHQTSLLLLTQHLAIEDAGLKEGRVEQEREDVSMVECAHSQELYTTHL